MSENGAAGHDEIDDLEVVGWGEDPIEPLALLISVVPLIGIVGGIISWRRGKVRNGRWMVAIGVVSLIVLAIVT